MNTQIADPHYQQFREFLRAFAQTTRLSIDDADAQWAAFSNQLSDSERWKIEGAGYDAGVAEGRIFNQAFQPDAKGVSCL